jgi:hypothetical protein
VSLHGKKGLNKEDKKRWHCDKILVHLKKFGPYVLIGSFATCVIDSKFVNYL